MISFPDFKEKKILYIHAQYGDENVLQLTNDNIRFVHNGKIADQISCHIVFAVFIVGDMSITTALLKKLSSYGISVFFLNHNLSTHAAMLSEAEGNYLLRQKQYTSTNELYIGVNIVSNKINNQEAILKKYKKSYDIKVFQRARKMLSSTQDNQELLGIEGNVGKTYFQSLFAELGWVRRAPQTKEDIANLLLDIGYTYLFNYCDALLRLFGFDTYKGYYHRLFFQRKSLVCDVMEPMRPLIDYQLVKSFNLNQINENDFVFKNGRFEFKNGFKSSKKYSSLFLQPINDKREDIYKYVLNFYRYNMDSIKYNFPQFVL